jgi:bidirectional [NiFe] hydrogenase diaphorase subunit
MVKLIINGRLIQADEGEMLLAVIRRERIDIPALCHHEAVEPYGACRLCTVEITKPEWNGWKNYVTSCLYPVAEGLIVTTHSEKVIELRRTILDLYLAAHPNTPEIIRLASEHGVNTTSYEQVPDSDDCIMCALCTRICEKMGFCAISTVQRGHVKEVASPLHESPPDCTGCLACARNCPTGHIKFTQVGNRMTIWGRQFELLTCRQCGRHTITREFADHLSRTKDIPTSYFEVCDACHRKETALTMGRIANWSREARI